MSDPYFYREYECNISAPYIKGWKAVKTPLLEADVVSANKYENLPLDADFDHTICMGIVRDVSSFSIGPTECPDLDEAVVGGHLEFICITDTTTGWFRGYIRGTAGQLSVLSLENVAVDFRQKIATINNNRIKVDLFATVPYVQWKLTTYNRS
jgi:hypothetical protein